MHQVVPYSSSTTMASYSSSSSSSSSLASQSPHPWRYDVFISFRGDCEGNSRSFCSLLCDALYRKAFLTFVDDDELQRGEEIAESIVQAIQESKVAVVVLSEGYASSTRCLDELVKIIECRQTRGQIVIPVFDDDVNQSDIRYQSYYVAEAFKRHEKNPRNAHKIQYWRDALVRTADLYGFNSEDFGNYHILISEIVEDISKQLPNTITNPEPQEQIDSPLHRHPLSTVEKIREDNGVLCEVCGELCFGPIYYECSVCRFYVHKSCKEIPKQLYSFYHKCRYFLLLLICPSYECGACTRAGFGGSYACIRCGFRLHLKCALRLPGNFEGLPHICHNLVKKIDCLSCKFPLEKPCSEHLVELQTPLHPEHTLFLYRSPDTRRCNVCLCDCPSGFFFSCDKCDFYCDPECIYLIPTIQFSNHDHHLLTVVDRVYDDVECDTCQKNCKGKPAFRCLKCEFNLHLLCGPLPHTIKHEHIHRLTFEDYVIDDKDEQYCYQCEEKRDPLLGVYYCKGCSYTAEVDCVMSEVIACLRGESEETVVLRCLNKQITKNNRVIIRGNAVEKLQNNAINEDLSEDELETEPSLFLDDVFEWLKEDEQNKFRDNIKTMVTELTWAAEYNYIIYRHCYYSDEEYIEEESSGSYNDQSSEECSESSEECSGNERRGHDLNIPEVSPYSDKAFTLLVQKLDSSTGSRKKIKLVLSDDEKQLVEYGKYITPRIFIPILKGLINGKHGDISSESMLDPRIKSICFMYLSEVIYSMRTTKVLKIRKDMLHTWWSRTKMLELVGFKVDFIQDRLMRVASAYFGLEARNFANKTSENQVSEIEQLEEKIKVLTGRVEELKLQHRNHLEYVKSATTPLMVNCFSDAKAMKWRPAADGLL